MQAIRFHAFGDNGVLQTDEVPVPDTLRTLEAAALPQVAMMAPYGLEEAIGLIPDERLLVHAAAGGVGHIAVQLPAATGAEVIECSARGTTEGGVVVTLPAESAADLVERLQADHVVHTRHFGLLRDGSPSLIDPVTASVAEVTIEPFVSRVSRRDQAVEALAEREAGQVRGNLVLDVATSG